MSAEEVSSTAERLDAVREQIARAAQSSGRDANHVKLIAVSKTVSLSKIEEAYQAGQRDFGENYVQELAEKANALSHLRDIHWHFLGHLQTNKAKAVARLGATVHSVDSQRLIKELARRRAALQAPPLSLLLEVNLGGEQQKGGCTPEEVEEFALAVEGEGALQLMGLMAIPPQGDHGVPRRSYFDQLFSLREQLGGRQRLPELSMGMSADYCEAISAGATMVRVGTAIFGPRVPRNAE